MAKTNSEKNEQKPLKPSREKIAREIIEEVGKTKKKYSEESSETKKKTWNKMNARNIVESKKNELVENVNKEE